jgi:hypothetical protein
MACLLELSHELLHCIFIDVEPADIVALSSCSRFFHDYIHGNRLLHRQLYIRRYDEFPYDVHTDWELLLHDRYQMECLLQTSNADRKREQLPFVARQMSTMIESAHNEFDQSKNLKLLQAAFKDRQDNHDVFLCSSSLFHGERAGALHLTVEPAEDASARQASAKMHCLYGVPIDTAPRKVIIDLMQPDLHIGAFGSTRSQTSGRQPMTHPWARSLVYDLQEYTPQTLWGPFHNDGSHRVDWEKVEAIMIVLGHNIRRYQGREESPVHGIWMEPFKGASPNSYHAAAPPILPPGTSAAAPQQETHDEDEDEESETFKVREFKLKLDALDPYGVSGTWMRVVCFLDYNDLYAFNFDVNGTPVGQPRGSVTTEEGLIIHEEIVCHQVPD